MTQAVRPIFRMSVIAIAFATLAGCGHMPTVQWPWAAKPAPPLPRADELLVTLGESSTVANFPQYWKRNTLLVDLQGVSGSGSVALRPRTGTQWPVRLAFRLAPGQVRSIEVVGDQRAILPITADGAKPVELELAPGIYTPKTQQLIVRWGPVAVLQSETG
jgi:predicted small lipoprotein YifL